MIDFASETYYDGEITRSSIIVSTHLFDVSILCRYDRGRILARARPPFYPQLLPAMHSIGELYSRPHKSCNEIRRFRGLYRENTHVSRSDDFIAPRAFRSSVFERVFRCTILRNCNFASGERRTCRREASSFESVDVSRILMIQTLMIATLA